MRTYKVSDFSLIFLAAHFALLARGASDGARKSTSNVQKVTLHIGGFFAFPNNPSLAAHQAVTETALDHLESLEGILDGYHLKMRWNWTGNADPEQALRVLYNLVSIEPPVVITTGPHHSAEASVVNQVAARYNIVQVGLASRDDRLANRTNYPYTVRSHPTYKAQLSGGAAYLRRMGWRRIAFIFEESDTFVTHMKEFRWILEAHNIDVVASEGVKDINNLDVHLQNLQRQDVRIIYIGFYSVETFKVYCQAYLAGMTSSRYVWIAPFWAGYGPWWVQPPPTAIQPCTAEQITQAVNSSLHFRIRQRQANLTDVDYNGVKPLPEHFEYFNRHKSVSEIARTYDNILLIALALNKSIADLLRLQPPRRLEDFSYFDSEMARVILKNADDINFIGLQGPVLIKNGERHADVTEIAQAQGEELNGLMIYKTEEQSLEPLNVFKPRWKGSHIPVDGVTTRRVILQVPSYIRSLLLSLASIAVAIALVFLFLNIKYRQKRAIKMSSPALGNLTIIGCILLHASVFVMALDTAQLSDTTIISKCHMICLLLLCVLIKLERILLSLGVSCAFGSVFMRAYRIHAIFTAVKRFKQIDLPDWKLIARVVIIVLIDCVIFVLWIALDTTDVYTLTLEPRLDMTDPKKEIFGVPEIRYCSSTYQACFIGMLYAAKGILLTFGLFLAWETKDIAVTRLSDSKSIAASVYIVTLSIALTVPTITVLDEEVSMTNIVPGVVTVAISTSVLCINFVPKVYLLVTKHDTITLSLMQSMGYGESTATTTQLRTTPGVVSNARGLRGALTERQTVLQQLLKEIPPQRHAKTGASEAKKRTTNQTLMEMEQLPT